MIANVITCALILLYIAQGVISGLKEVRVKFPEVRIRWKKTATWISKAKIAGHFSVDVAFAFVKPALYTRLLFIDVQWHFGALLEAQAA